MVVILKRHAKKTWLSNNLVVLAVDVRPIPGAHLKVNITTTETLKLLLSSLYITDLATSAVAYGISIYVVEVTRKSSSKPRERKFGIDAVYLHLQSLCGLLL
ncbi:uncharacterized protein LOC143598218 [Bidens hawaiensis]|uniref:uncharacterized protein LOC143598218 n=1 Tax=Bidens hawaiensis TaxID=980011 RepID=UPI00404974B4